MAICICVVDLHPSHLMHLEDKAVQQFLHADGVIVPQVQFNKNIDILNVSVLQRGDGYNQVDNAKVGNWGGASYQGDQSIDAPAMNSIYLREQTRRW